MLRSAAVLALTAFAYSASAEDLTITYKTSDGGSTTEYFTKDKIRTNNGKTDTILEFASGKIVNIDHQKKQYSEITIAEIQEVGKSMAAQMEQQMANMPPQVREKMAGMMGGAMGDATLTKGEAKTVAGYPCQSWTLALGATWSQETCNSTALTPPFDPANFQKLAAVSIPMMQGMEKVFQKMAQIQGLSLSQRTSMNMMGRKTDTTREATEVKKGAIAADVFAIPAGYQQVESPMKKMGRPGPR
jgi:hypothetical protein